MQIISYGPHELQKIKVFHFSPGNNHTLVLIHGGAWNDVRNTYDDFSEMVGYLKADTGIPIVSGLNIVGINYRLSPQTVHPGHLQDVVMAINHLADKWHVGRVSVAGHSVGATLVLQMLNYRQIIEKGVADLDLATAPQGHHGHHGHHEYADISQFHIPDLSKKISLQWLFFIDGIYDIGDLVEEYGPAFKNAVVVQSSEDELLSLRQSHNFGLKGLNEELKDLNEELKDLNEGSLVPLGPGWAIDSAAKLLYRGAYLDTRDVMGVVFCIHG
ncbi:hypothetical protein JCM33374_g2206 [Metschnikowia sp. JCM 33374]|nr:hypothetical protein JCM33374_g2206 [Metschnikowia sp. JCM 33374]